MFHPRPVERERRVYMYICARLSTHSTSSVYIYESGAIRSCVSARCTHTLYYPLHTHAGNVKKCPKAAGYIHKCIAAAAENSVQVEREKEQKPESLFSYFSYIASSSTLTWSETVSCVRAVGCCGSTLSCSHSPTNFCQLFFSSPIFFLRVVWCMCAVP